MSWMWCWLQSGMQEPLWSVLWGVAMGDFNGRSTCKAESLSTWTCEGPG
jgi:hypothetical protein